MPHEYDVVVIGAGTGGYVAAIRAADPVATMISRRARSVCFSPSNTSTALPPASRAVPLIQSILFFLNRNSTPLESPVTIRSLRACT